MLSCTCTIKVVVSNGCRLCRWQICVTLAIMPHLINCKSTDVIRRVNLIHRGKPSIELQLKLYYFDGSCIYTRTYATDFIQCTQPVIYNIFQQDGTNQNTIKPKIQLLSGNKIEKNTQLLLSNKLEKKVYSKQLEQSRIVIY